MHRRLGELLVDGEFATRRQIDTALELQKQRKGTQLADILVEQGVLNEQEEAAVLRIQSLLDSVEDAMHLAGDGEQLADQLVAAHCVKRTQINRILESRPSGRGELVELLLEADVIDAELAEACNEVPEQPDVACRAAARVRLGDLLVEHGDIDDRQLQQALDTQRSTGKRLGRVLMDLGLVTAGQLRYGLKLQRKLLLAAFGAAIAFSHAPAMAAPHHSHEAGTANHTHSAFHAGAEVDFDHSDDHAHFPELRDRVDGQLQAALNGVIQDMGLQKAVQSKQLSLALVDVTDSSAPRMATVNADHMMYAASLPKIGILLGAFQKIHEGGMQLDNSTRNALTRMIRNSSNSAATAMYNAVGPDYLASVLQSEAYGLYDPQHNGGLWVGKPYAKGSAWKRDPLHGISHGASVMQVARFLYLMETGQLVSPELSAEMKEMLARPAIKHKFVKGLANHRPGSKVYRKSGTWRTYHSDGAVVERDGRKYIAVALANSQQGSAWLSNLIVEMDDIIFDERSDTRTAKVARVAQPAS